VSRLRGRFSAPTDPEMDRFSSSIEVDLAMAQDDIAGSRAHAIMLGEVGVISPEDARSLVEGLEQIGRELESGQFVPNTEHEDIHMAVEGRLFELLGETAGKLHTARSRNDQVATDVRLWLLRQLERLDDALQTLIRGLVDQARSVGQVLMPGYTHLQRGQPILLGHHLLGHIWPVVRDRQRLAEAWRRLDASPLGACALAGTGLPIDRQRTAELLGFSGVVENALDAVAARDHEQEVAAVCAIAMTHFSRMAAELVLWSSAEFRFVRLDQAYATGSSIMPQKRNPDAAELVRGKAARVYGDLVTLLTLAKGLPLAYNRDLQEDRRPLFDALETTLSSAAIMAAVWRTSTFDKERFESELVGDDSLATELADALVERGVPFRLAHERVGALVQDLESRGRRMSLLEMADLERNEIDLPPESIRDLLDPRQAVGRRTSHGGTCWSEIERQLELVEATLS
jgi:argininosuccinate lyase